METAFVVFAVGIAVTLVVAKGILQANEFAKQELKRLNDLNNKNNPE